MNFSLLENYTRVIFGRNQYCNYNPKDCNFRSEDCYNKPRDCIHKPEDCICNLQNTGWVFFSIILEAERLEKARQFLDYRKNSKVFIDCQEILLEWYLIDEKYSWSIFRSSINNLRVILHRGEILWEWLSSSEECSQGCFLIVKKRQTFTRFLTWKCLSFDGLRFLNLHGECYPRPLFCSVVKVTIL